MKKVLIIGEGSYIGGKVAGWLRREPKLFHVDVADAVHDHWRKVDFSQYDTVYNVAGIAHVKARKEEEPLYYAVNRDLVIELARTAKSAGVGQFIHMSSMIVYKEVKTLAGKHIHPDTEPTPNGFYGDSKLQGEQGLRRLDCDTFHVCILRPPMIYGPGCRGNFPKLVRLARRTPVFPDYHNQRSMLYIDNLCEFVRQAILRDCRGTFFPQNSEYVSTVDIVRWFARQARHRLWITPWLNGCVRLLGSHVRPVGKMFSDSIYDKEMSQYEFSYQIVSTEESFRHIHQ